MGDWLNEQWTTNLGHPGGIGELIQLVSGANIGSIYRGALAAGGSAFGLLLTLLFMMIALFFAYRDGEAFRWRRSIVSASASCRPAGSGFRASCRRRSPRR